MGEDQYAVVMMNEGSRPFRISANVGERIPIPWTASGRLLLAHMSDAQIDEFVPDEDFTLPDGSRLEKSDFSRSARQALAEGFFSFDSLSDTYTHCFAAPVFDRSRICVATLCLIAPKEDAKTNFSKYRDVLTQSANKLSAELFADQQSDGLAAE